MRFQNLLFTGLLLAGFTACDQNTKSDNNAQIPPTDAAKPEQAEVIKPASEPVGTKISDRMWDFSGRDSSWTSAKATTYKDTITFKDVDVSVLITFNALSKDTNNYMVKDVTVTTLKENDKYAVTATITDQINTGTKQKYNSYVRVDMKAELKPGKVSTTKLEGKSVVLHAKNGKVEIL